MDLRKILLIDILIAAVFFIAVAMWAHESQFLHEIHEDIEDINPNGYVYYTVLIMTFFLAVTGIAIHQIHIHRQSMYIIKHLCSQVAVETENRHQRHKLESLGALAGGLSHEINNALQPILGLTGVLRTEIGDEATPNTLKYLDTINQSALHARDIVQKVLIFSRKDNELEIKTHNLLELLDEIVNFATSLVPSSVSVSRQGFGASADISKPIFVDLDHTGLTQAILNLFVNASHAMEQSGNIKVRLTKNRLNKNEANMLHIAHGEYAVISIADNGCGMSAEMISKIFEPFYTTKNTGHNAGLGLAMTYGLLKDMNGTITVSSFEGIGTEFQLYLPISKEKEDKEESTGEIV